MVIRIATRGKGRGPRVALCLEPIAHDERRAPAVDTGVPALPGFHDRDEATETMGDDVSRYVGVKESDFTRVSEMHLLGLGLVQARPRSSPHLLDDVTLRQEVL